MVSSATVSEEWDALPMKAAAVPRVIDPQGSVWTAPETWVASAARQKAVEEAAAAAAAVAGEESTVVAEEEESASAADLAAETLVAAEAEGLDGKKKAAFMADAYAFGMIAWEVSMGMNVAAGISCLPLALRMRSLEALRHINPSPIHNRNYRSNVSTRYTAWQSWFLLVSLCGVYPGASSFRFSISCPYLSVNLDAVFVLCCRVSSIGLSLPNLGWQPQRGQR